VTFPLIDPSQWRVIGEPAVEPSPKDEASYIVRLYERVSGGSH
jgi:dihydrofolate reductase